MVARWISHLLGLTTAQSLRLCTWWIHSAVPAGKRFLFIALRWMQPDRGMMWQAENPELAREFPAGTASKARQSRLHQAQVFFPVFVFHSFVQFLNINVSKTKNYTNALKPYTKPYILFRTRSARNVQNLMRHLMGINGETFLAGSFLKH